jgi:hypothetical protein
MPNPFSINVVTPAGSALIAQATATNQIVFIGAKSGTTAATDAEDLAGKDVSFYDGASGTIDACSATNNVAKIVSRFGNTPGAAQIVKSVCILGRLANQTDAQAVIVAAMSDDASEIYLPSSASPTQIIRFPFNITIDADEDVETAYADGATIADLQRFVSMYKAGDPTQGEDQEILGEKTFAGEVTFGNRAVFDDSASFSDANFNNVVEFQNTVEFNDVVTFNDTINGVLVTTSSIGELSTENGMLGIKYSNVLRSNLSFAGLYLYDANGTISLKLDSATGDITGNAATFTGLSGIAPNYVNNTLTVPVGAMIYAWSGEIVSQLLHSDLQPGEWFDVPANTIYNAKWSGLGSGTTGAYVKGDKYITAGHYRAICGLYMSDGGTNTAILLQRIS